jgi:ribosomal protein S25
MDPFENELRRLSEELKAEKEAAQAAKSRETEEQKRQQQLREEAFAAICQQVSIFRPLLEKVNETVWNNCGRISEYHSNDKDSVRVTLEVIDREATEHHYGEGHSISILLATTRKLTLSGGSSLSGGVPLQKYTYSIGDTDLVKQIQADIIKLIRRKKTHWTRNPPSRGD